MYTCFFWPTFWFWACKYNVLILSLGTNMASQRKLINQKIFSTQYYSITFEMREIGSIESIFMRVRAHVCLHWTRRKNRVRFPVTWEYWGSPKAHLARWDVQAGSLGNKLVSVRNSHIRKKSKFETNCVLLALHKKKSNPENDLRAFIFLSEIL